MNVLFLSSWYPTKQNPNFGVFVKEHAHAIKTGGNEIIVLAIVVNQSSLLYSKSVTETIDEHGIRTITIEINSKFKDIIYHFVPLQYIIVKKLYRTILNSNFNPDIIHSNVVFPCGIIGSWLSAHTKKPHIITEHWSRVKSIVSKPVLGKMAIKAYKKALFILPVSKFLQENIRMIIPDLEASKFHIVGNVVDTKTFFYNKKIKNSEIISFCAIATWTNKKIPDKMPEIFIEALAYIQKQIDQTIILTMIGGGNKIAELKAICESKGLKAEFVGYQDKPEIVKQLHKSDYLVHASTIETFGVVVAEALLTGTPVVCSNVGALPELIDETNGVLCQNTIEEWIAGIREIMGKQYNNKDIAENVKHRFSPQSIGETINESYAAIHKNL